MEEYMNKQLKKIVAVSQYLTNKLNCMVQEYNVNGFDLDNFNTDVDSLKGFSVKIFSEIIKDNNELAIALDKKSSLELESEKIKEERIKQEVDKKIKQNNAEATAIKNKKDIDDLSEDFGDVDFDNEDEL